MPYPTRERKREMETLQGVTPGTYKYNQRHHIGVAGSKFYINKIKVRLGERIARTEAEIHQTEREIEKLST